MCFFVNLFRKEPETEIERFDYNASKEIHDVLINSRIESAVREAIFGEAISDRTQKINGSFQTSIDYTDIEDLDIQTIVKQINGDITRRENPFINQQFFHPDFEEKIDEDWGVIDPRDPSLQTDCGSKICDRITDLLSDKLGPDALSNNAFNKIKKYLMLLCSQAVHATALPIIHEAKPFFLNPEGSSWQLSNDKTRRTITHIQIEEDSIQVRETCEDFLDAIMDIEIDGEIRTIPLYKIGKIFIKTVHDIYSNKIYGEYHIILNKQIYQRFY